MVHRPTCSFAGGEPVVSAHHESDQTALRCGPEPTQPTRINAAAVIGPAIARANCTVVSPPRCHCVGHARVVQPFAGTRSSAPRTPTPKAASPAAATAPEDHPKALFRQARFSSADLTFSACFLSARVAKSACKTADLALLTSCLAFRSRTVADFFGSSRCFDNGLPAICMSLDENRLSAYIAQTRLSVHDPHGKLKC